MNFKPKSLTKQEFQQKRQEFQDLSLDRKKRQQARQQMHQFFKERPAELDYEYYHSYFLWYTKLSCDKIFTLDSNFISEIFVPRQIVLAYALGFDVWERFIFYLNRKCTYEDEIKQVFLNSKKNFLDSNSVLGEEDGEKITFSDLKVDFEKLQTKDDLSLAKAEFITRLSEIIKSHDNDWYKYTPKEVTKIAEEFYKLCDFFVKVDIDRIFHIVRGYLYPHLYKNQEETGESESTPQSFNQQEQNKEVDFSNIRQKVESQLGEIEKLDPANITNFKKVLKAAAKQEGIEQDVEDWYYFDSQQGNFVWNEEKINQN